ncbi:exodeoxyribonuclease VII small subunit [Lonepinella sp. BR2357]|uniref:exodeoxyribonuclease VII small subunit n=1 Tax=Lonepinella sp. BR2357 TaxID=3434549 RepID=UPI003F6E20ED
MARKPKETETELDFESTLTQLEQVVNQLESGDLPLEEALKTFENGVNLAKLGQQRLQQAEQRIQILLQKNATAELNDYHQGQQDDDLQF